MDTNTRIQYDLSLFLYMYATPDSLQHVKEDSLSKAAITCMVLQTYPATGQMLIRTEDAGALSWLQLTDRAHQLRRGYRKADGTWLLVVPSDPLWILSSGQDT